MIAFLSASVAQLVWTMRDAARRENERIVAHDITKTVAEAIRAGVWTEARQTWQADRDQTGVEAYDVSVERTPWSDHAGMTLVTIRVSWISPVEGQNAMTRTLLIGANRER